MNWTQVPLSNPNLNSIVSEYAMIWHFLHTFFYTTMYFITCPNISAFFRFPIIINNTNLKIIMFFSWFIFISSVFLCWKSYCQQISLIDCLYSKIDNKNRLDSSKACIKFTWISSLWVYSLFIFKWQWTQVFSVCTNISNWPIFARL